MKIIDAHVHPFIMPKQNFSAHESIKDSDEFHDYILQSGISQIIGSVLYKCAEPCLEFSRIEKLNETGRSLAEKWKGFYTYGIQVHPHFSQESCFEIEKYYSLGVRIIGELCPYLVGYNSYLEKGMSDILNLAQDLGMVVCFHTTTVEEIEVLKKLYPRLIMVFAHPAYGDEYKNRLKAIRDSDNLFMDLSGTGIAAYGMLEYGVSIVGSEKLIFGTDYPIYDPIQYIVAVERARIKHSEKDLIFCGNAKRVYQLK